MPTSTAYDSDTDDDIGHLRSAEESSSSSGQTHAETAETPSQSLNDAEAQSADPNLYNANGEKGNRLGNIRGRISGLSQNKLLVGGALGGIGGVVGLVLLLTLAVGPYKIVALAEHMSAYQFARVTRDAAKNSEAVTSEKMGIDIADDSLAAKIKARYATGSGKTKDLWEKFDKYRPNKVLANFQNSGKLNFNYETTKLGRQRLTSVTIENTDVKLIRGASRNLIPGYNFVSGAKASRDFSPRLMSSLKANDIGPLTRARIAREIRQKAGISLTAWVLGKYLPKPGATAAEAQQAAYAAEEQLAFDFGEGFASTGSAAEIAGATNLNDTATKAKAAEFADVHSPTEINNIIKDPNQLTIGYENVVNDAIKTARLSAVRSILATVLKIINPIYGAAVPLCLVYEGSMLNAGPIIDAQSTQIERTALLTQVEAAQQKDGRTVSAAAVEAANWKHADISKSNAYARASGQTIDTSNYSSAQATPYGQYSRSLADLVPGPAGTFISAIGTSCPFLTNVWVGLGIGVANLGVAFLTGGASAAGEGVTEGTIDVAVSEVVPSLAQRIVGRLITGGNFTKEFGFTVAKQVGAIEGATLLAKQLVMSQTGAVHSSLATGDSYNNDNDSGLNIYAGQLEAQQHYGAPLSDSELQADDTANKTFLAVKEQQKSTFNRYLAVSNSNSLLMHAGIIVSAHLNQGIFRSLLTMVGNIFSPLRAGNSILASAMTGTTYADGPVTSANTYYGNVQFGYTREENKLKKTESYRPFENQQILDDSKAEADIGTTYHGCFDGSKTIGSMLQNGDIERDKNGDVLTSSDKGVCSPGNVGPHNKTYGDLVFRWRVAKAYDHTIEQLVAEQDVTN